MSAKLVKVIKHLRRRDTQMRISEGKVRKPHTFTRPPLIIPAKPAKLKRKLGKPQRARYVPANPRYRATRLEDFFVLDEKPPRRFRPTTEESRMFTAVPGKPVPRRYLEGVNQKEIFVMVGNDEEDIRGKALFKPASGESEFTETAYAIPQGEQYRREAIADTIDDLLGWDIVPPTQIRTAYFDGEDQIGSLQEWIENAEPGEGKDWKRTGDLYKIASLDIIMANRDRHGRNLIHKGNRTWAIDNGISMGELPGLRNEVWNGYAGEKIPTEIRQDLNDLEEGDLRAALAGVSLNPTLQKNLVEEAVARWKWLKDQRFLPSKTEVVDFQFKWLKENRSRAERARLTKLIFKANQEGGGEYRNRLTALDKDGDLNICEECRGEHVGSAGRHQREQNQKAQENLIRMREADKRVEERMAAAAERQKIQRQIDEERRKNREVGGVAHSHPMDYTTCKECERADLPGLPPAHHHVQRPKSNR